MVKAVFGWPAIHTRRPGKEKQPTLETIFRLWGKKFRRSKENGN